MTMTAETPTDSLRTRPGSRGSWRARRRSATSTEPTAGCSIGATRSASSSSRVRIRPSPTCSGPASGIPSADWPRRQFPARSWTCCARYRRRPSRWTHCARPFRRGARPGSALAADRWAGARDHVVLAFGAGRLRAPARRQEADRPRPVARPGRGLPVPAQRHAPGRGHGARAGCLFHRRRRARLQRLNLHRARRDLDAL